MLFATFLPYTTNPQSQNLQKYDKTCVFGPILYVKNALLWVTMVLKSSLWCLGDLREPQQQLPMLFATFFPYTTNPQSQNLQNYDKNVYFAPFCM